MFVYTIIDRRFRAIFVQTICCRKGSFHSGSDTGGTTGGGFTFNNHQRTNIEMTSTRINENNGEDKGNEEEVKELLGT